MSNFKMEKYINTLGDLRRAAGVAYFIFWVITTVAGLLLVDSLNEVLVRFFLGPIGAAILTYYLKRAQYRAMPVKLNKDESISWEPLAYGLFILPAVLTLIFLMASFWGMIQPVAWIPTALLVNVGIQYAFFTVFGQD
jgi:hypothetical protein